MKMREKGSFVIQSTSRKSDVVQSYARRLNIFNKIFFTGEDVGIDEDDIREMTKETNCIIGKPGVAGDPSPWAALGVFSAMKAALQAVFEKFVIIFIQSE